MRKNVLPEYATFSKYRQTYNISYTLVGNNILHRPDVDGASPVGAAPTTSSFLTYLTSLDWAKTTARRDKQHLSLRFGAAHITDLTVDFVEDAGGECESKVRRNAVLKWGCCQGTSPSGAVSL